MKNLIKTLNYQTRRDNITYYAYIAALVGLLLGCYTEDGIILNLTGSEYFTQTSGVCGCISIIFYFSIIITRICGWDYSDKTINFQLLGGHSRNNVFWSRIWVSFIRSVPVGIFLYIFPPIFLTLKNGWGINADIYGIIFRCFLAVLIILRIYSECVLFTFLTKSCYTGLVISGMSFFLSNQIVSFITMLKEHAELSKPGIISSMSNLFDIMSFHDYDFQYINGVDERIYNSEIDSGYAALTITVSVLICIVSIFFSWCNFKKTDMK